MSGTINISRDLWDDAAFRDEPFSEREAWVWMIAEASWKDREKRVGSAVVNLCRGEFSASIRFMALAWKWTAAKVQRFMDRLKKLEMIRVKTDTGMSVVTICNYEKYQVTQKQTDTSPIQHRYSTDTNEKKGEIREEGKKEIEAKASRRETAKHSEISPIIEAWASPGSVASFMAYRAKSKGKALTLTAAKRLATNLKAIFDRGGDTDDALGMAEERGWLTVEADWYFNAKGKVNGYGNHGTASRPGDGSSTIAAFAAVAARHSRTTQ